MVLMRAWKIKNESGLFSTGSMEPRFTKKGKTWHALTHVEAHLRLLFEGNKDAAELYAGCKVISYLLTAHHEKPLEEVLEEIEKKDKKRLQA